MADGRELFQEALKGKKLPILTLDNKWHKIFTRHIQDKRIRTLSSQLNELVAKQGGLNQEVKEIRKLKAKLMDEIVSGMDGTTLSAKEMKEHKRLVDECNEKIEANQDRLLELPGEIDQVNFQLMLRCMEVCYEIFAQNTKEIAEIADWIAGMRIELKRNVIRKQEKEAVNQELYTYMHNIFGPDVMEIFDMKYDPSENSSKKGSDTKQDGKMQS